MQDNRNDSRMVEYDLPRDIFPKARSMVVSRLGYSTQNGLDPDISAMVDRAIENIVSSARPRGIYRFVAIKGLARKGIITLPGIVESSMFKQLVRISKGEKYLVFIVTTLGLGLDDLYGKDDNLTWQMVSDAAASEMTEIAADKIDELTWQEEALKEGFEYTWRFSPGYCDWKLTGQEVIFNAVDAEAIGVSLTSSYVMKPEKSISAIALIAESIPFKAPCAFCTRKDCPWRRLPMGETNKGMM